MLLMIAKSVLIYSTGIDEVISGSSKVAGIQVQMYFWARTFIDHGWTVYSFSNRNTAVVDGIHFIKKKNTWIKRHGLGIVQDFFEGFHYIFQTRAETVLARAGRRDLLAISLAGKWLNSKLVFLGASDRDFEPGRELIEGSKINVLLYHKGLRRVRFFVTQNQFQADNLLKHYGKSSVIIPNIWINSEDIPKERRVYDCIWVANLRRLKRAEWFINLACQLPQYRFAIVGGENERDYYEAMKEKAMSLPNIDFLGAQPMNVVNSLMGQSRLLVNTSEFEGFPNTFLQAWANDIPIVSTVNPSGCIAEYGLGCVVTDESQLLQSVCKLLDDPEEYALCQKNISGYFLSHHDADRAYQKVMDLIDGK